MSITEQWMADQRAFEAAFLRLQDEGVVPSTPTPAQHRLWVEHRDRKAVMEATWHAALEHTRTSAT